MSGPRIEYDTAPAEVACQELVWGDDERKDFKVFAFCNEQMIGRQNELAAFDLPITSKI
ncbi:hypothetical protein [Pseudobutyrivibrio sp. JW11]|uniref:hypothetical protein n=1 Tax=Pseudobutyrivibrio sp. JW11 TaxID=1855302 RepID=UPI0015A62678|nr:hypothetical protein [Pseudobutyrivibrio sp. JW11]